MFCYLINSESFNAYVGLVRDKPIISLLDWIKVKLMKKWHIEYIGMLKHGGFYCPNEIIEL